MTHHAFSVTRALAALAVITRLAACGGGGDDPAVPPPPPATPSPTAFQVSSPDLASQTFDNTFVLNGFGCSGGNVSPAIAWKNVPAGTQAFALQMHDLDAPTGSGIWHWAVYDIPASATGLDRGAGNGTLPAPAYGGDNDLVNTGVTGVNGNYGGPCPAQGDAPHRYQFTLYAYGVPNLATATSIPKDASTALYSFALNELLGPQLLGKAEFVTPFSR